MESNSSDIMLQVDAVNTFYGNAQILFNLGFKIDRGEIVVLLGRNGAGKSTCFNLINGQLRPDYGKVVIMGKKINGYQPRQVWKLGVGRTFQITSTFASMTVLENIKMAVLSHHRQTRSLFSKVRRLYTDESMALLKLVGIEDQHERTCGVLAYGDLKRVELAVALANQPKLLLMDEPTAGMGPAERQSLMELTSDIVRNQNIGVLFTEHDMEVVFTHADRIIVLNRGELVAEGTPGEVRRNAKVQEIYLGSRVEIRR